MSLYAGIDLHSNNNYVVVIDERDQVVWRRKQANEAGVVLRSLAPFWGLMAGVVVESTYNPSGPDLRLVLVGGCLARERWAGAFSEPGSSGAIRRDQVDQ